MKKIAPASGRQASLPANGMEGPLLISWPVTLRDEPEERTHGAVSQALRRGSAAKNTCDAFAERIKQKGNRRPWALGHQPSSAISASQIRALPTGFLGCRKPAVDFPSLLRAQPPLQLHNSTTPEFALLCLQDGLLP